MVSPQKIKYNGVEINVALNPLSVILDVAFDSDNGAIGSHLNRSAIASESHDGRYKNTYRYKYDELFSPQFTIVKADFSDFTQSEIRQVLKYLTQTDKPALLEVYYDKNSAAADWCAIGGWTNIETYKLANNRTVGIVATFEAITPHALSSLQTSSGSQLILIETDDNQPIYPRITITMNSNGDVAIGNVHNSKAYTTTIKNNIAGEIITINCANRIISSSRATGRIFGDDFNWTWLPLYDGENQITVAGNCTVEFEYRTVIKCGEC
jgi:phage-related protein